MSRQLWALSQHSDHEVFDIVYYVPLFGLSEERQYPVVSDNVFPISRIVSYTGIISFKPTKVSTTNTTS